MQSEAWPGQLLADHAHKLSRVQPPMDL
eukprot:SAG22_NODE_20985_length_261_cov_0.617284_1_plen_27_part_01